MAEDHKTGNDITIHNALHITPKKATLFEEWTPVGAFLWHKKIPCARQGDTPVFFVFSSQFCSHDARTFGKQTGCYALSSCVSGYRLLVKEDCQLQDRASAKLGISNSNV
jgi:hypothetical protein